MNNGFDRIKALILQIKGLTTIGISDVIASAIGAVFWLYMAATLGAENYGVVSYFLAIGGIASTISLLGSQTTLTVYTAKNVRLESTVYFIAIIAGIISSFVLFFMFQDFGLISYVFGVMLFGLINGELLGKRLYKEYAKYIIVQKSTMAVLAIGLYYIIGVQGVVLGVGLSFFIYVIRIYQGFRTSKIDFSLLKSRSGFITNNYLLDLSSALNGSLDKLIIVPFLGFELLGNYQLGLQLLSILLILPSIIYKYTLPHDASGIPTQKIKNITISISAGITVLGVLVSPIIIPPLFPKYIHVIDIIQILSFAMVPATTTLLYNSKFLGVEKTKIVLYGAGIHLAVLVTAIITLGNYFGVKGVAISYVLATSIHAIFYLGMDKTKNRLT